MAIAVLSGWLGPTLAASIGLGLAFSGVPGLITLYVVENTTLDDFGPSYAAATLAFGVSQMLAPQIGGIIADVSGSFTLVFMLSSAFAVTGALSALRLPRRTDPNIGTSEAPTSRSSLDATKPSDVFFLVFVCEVELAGRLVAGQEHKGQHHLDDLLSTSCIVRAGRWATDSVFARPTLDNQIEIYNF